MTALARRIPGNRVLKLGIVVTEVVGTGHFVATKVFCERIGRFTAQPLDE